MPKVNWIGGKPKPKQINQLAALLRCYKLASGLSSDEIGEKLGVTGDHVRHLLGKPADSWRVGDLKKLCDAVGCPYDEAMQAAAK